MCDFVHAKNTLFVMLIRRKLQKKLKLWKSVILLFDLSHLHSNKTIFFSNKLNQNDILKENKNPTQNFLDKEVECKYKSL